MDQVRDSILPDVDIHQTRSLARPEQRSKLETPSQIPAMQTYGGNPALDATFYLKPGTKQPAWAQ